VDESCREISETNKSEWGPPWGPGVDVVAATQARSMFGIVNIETRVQEKKALEKKRCSSTRKKRRNLGWNRTTGGKSATQQWWELLDPETGGTLKEKGVHIPRRKNKQFALDL